MPANKMALLRYQTINQCLTNPYRIWHTQDLVEALSRAYQEHTGSTKGISRSTLFIDLNAMKPGGATGYEAPIAHSKPKGHHYTQPGYTISQMPLTRPRRGGAATGAAHAAGDSGRGLGHGAGRYYPAGGKPAGPDG